MVTKASSSSPNTNHLTKRILLGMGLGVLLGLLLRFLPLSTTASAVLVDEILKTGGDIFIRILKMLVVPVVFVSLVCGSSALEIKKLGRIGGKTLLLYLLTTAVSVTLALCFASLFSVGQGSESVGKPAEFILKEAPSLKHVVLNLVPVNPFRALVEGKMLQIILFSLLFGLAVAASGEPGKRVAALFQDLNAIVIQLVTQLLKISPYGVFCLMSVLFFHLGFDLIWHLLGYFSVVLFVLLVHLLVSYPVLLRVLGSQ